MLRDKVMVALRVYILTVTHSVIKLFNVSSVLMVDMVLACHHCRICPPEGDNN